jgi:hypothetical protein
MKTLPRLYSQVRPRLDQTLNTLWPQRSMRARNHVKSYIRGIWVAKCTDCMTTGTHRRVGMSEQDMEDTSTNYLPLETLVYIILSKCEKLWNKLRNVCTDQVLILKNYCLHFGIEFFKKQSSLGIHFK